MRRVVLAGFRCELALGDVGDRADVPRHHAVLVARQASLDVHPTHGRPFEPGVDDRLLHTAAGEFGERLLQPRSIVEVQRVGHQIAQRVFGRASREARPHRSELRPSAIRAHVPDDDADVLDDGAVSLFGLLPGSFCRADDR